MSVQYTAEVGWHWTCLWGCFAYGYDNGEDARLGFFEHDCEVWR